jgi:hypothetical protein
MIGRHAVPFVVGEPKQMLRGRVALLGAAPVPVGGKDAILRHAAPGRVHESELRLRARIAAFGRKRDLRQGACGGHGANGPSAVLGALCRRAGQQGESGHDEY